MTEIEEKKLIGLQKQEKKLMFANMPTFERGIAEASLERESKIWEELNKVFIAHEIEVSVSTSLKTDNQATGLASRPALSCSGVLVSIQFLVAPMDKKGMDGKMSDEDFEKLQEIRREIASILKKLNE